ncbi:FecR family protein [bacterium A37T11]|nr:FecR family protein [bacterium A37T11]
MSKKQHIDALFEKFVAGNCTKEEEDIMWQYFNDLSQRNYMESLISQELENNSQPNQATVKLIKRENVQPFQLIKWAVAVLVLLIPAALLIHEYNIKKGKNASVGAKQSLEIFSGGNKATLTLANGTKVLLDTLKKNDIEEDRGVQISKTADGSLVYNSINQGLASKKEASAMNTLETPRGGQCHIILPDGTQVWLNAASTLTYPTNFTGNERKVFLKGEGYFEVNHTITSKERPFIVQTLHQQVQVLGTRFNVNAYENEPNLKTTLLQGSVRIVAGNSSRILLPGQQSSYTKDKLEVSLVDTETVIDWKNGDFIFAGESLPTIMRRIARWYDVKVVFQDNIKSDEFGGQISRKKNLSKVLRILELSGDVTFKIKDKTILVSKRIE